MSTPKISQFQTLIYQKRTLFFSKEDSDIKTRQYFFQKKTIKNLKIMEQKTFQIKSN